MNELFSVRLDCGDQALTVRQAARRLAARLGFEHQDQVRIATAVSELVRTAAGRGGQASMRLGVEDVGPQQALVIRLDGAPFADPSGPPAADAARRRDLDGLAAARRLLDSCVPVDAPGTVVLKRSLPAAAPRVSPDVARSIRAEFEAGGASAEEGYGAELRRQDRALSTTLVELEGAQQELARLNAELNDTNRGVMALYAELEERANRLREADELKTRFFSNMSHEFRMPLNSVLALTQLLLERADGPLNDEQARQVGLIRGATRDLLDLVNDLLDLAKVEAGKSTVNVGRFSVSGLFGALRGMMRPLLPDGGPVLEFDASPDLPAMVGDEAKVAQVLRNFLSNALKFTEAGSITVLARSIAAGERCEPLPEPVPRESILFCVADTGIGIAKADQERIFDEFTQVRHSLQRSVRGTGLGLPVCRKLAWLLGGAVWVDSEVGAGSRFYFLVPRFYRPSFESVEGLPARTAAARAGSAAASTVAEGETTKAPILVVVDADADRARVEAIFEGSAFAPVTALGADVSGDYLEALEPCAALDLRAGEPSPAAACAEPSQEAAAAIRAAGVPLLAMEPGFAAAADAAWFAGVVDELHRAVIESQLGRVLLVDDDEGFRSVLAAYTKRWCRDTVTSAGAEDALDVVRAGGVDCAVLDLVMPGLDGLTLLMLLRDDPATRHLPVLVCSSKQLSEQEEALLRELDSAFLPKDRLAPNTLARALVEAGVRARGSRRQQATPLTAGAH